MVGPLLNIRNSEAGAIPLQYNVIETMLGRKNVKIVMAVISLTWGVIY